MMRSRVLAVVVAALASVAPQSAFALVNPTLQPGDLYDRHNVVLGLKITAIDEDKQTVELTVSRVCKGTFDPKKVVISLENEKVQEAFHILPREGETVVAFLGQKRRGQEKTLLFYAGGEGRWQVGRLASLTDTAKWQWTEDLGPQKMYGTFNGSAERLAEMMEDKREGRYFFPAVAFDQFKEDLVVDRFAKSVRGVALYDIDGDGKLDIYACCETGNRAYLQTDKLKFVDATEKLGLIGVKSASCNFADVNADGRADLLADGVIFLQSANGKLAKSDLLPPEANQDVKMSAFVDINGDGYPDVVVSKVKGGLQLYLNPGPKGGPFRNATTEAGLNRKENGAGQTGFFMHGDWNGDGRTAIFYAASGGLLLVQDDQAGFTPVKDPLQFDFRTDGQEAGLTGAGCFAPIWRPDRQDVVFSRDGGVNIVANAAGKPVDAAQYGNEIVVANLGHLPAIAEDLNADGNVDIYVGSRSALPNTYYMNRGYGSFIVPTRYRPKAIPGKAHQEGAWGLAAGDVDGDGTNDLLLGGTNGVLTLVLNNTLSLRKADETSTSQEKKLQQTSILTVRVCGKLGVLGARVTLADNQGRIVGRRDIGSNVATGCRGPDTVNIAVREPGQYNLKVRYSDGLERQWPIDLLAAKRAVIDADREKAP